MRGHSRSKASIKALVRQLPRRTHIEMNACAPENLTSIHRLFTSRGAW